MPRKKSGKKDGKKVEGRSTSAASSSSSSSGPRASASESKVEVATVKAEAPLPAAVAHVAGGEDKPSLPPTTAEDASGIAEARGNMMAQLQRKLDATVKPKFVDTDIEEAEKKFAKLATSKKSAESGISLSVGGKATKMVTSDDILTDGKENVTVTKSLVSEVDDESFSVVGGKKKGKKPSQLKEKKDENVCAVRKTPEEPPASATTKNPTGQDRSHILRSQQLEYQKMMDLRGALSAELNFRLGARKRLVDGPATPISKGADESKKPSGGGAASKSSGSATAVAAQPSKPADNSQLRGPLGGESLASIIGRRREELQRKKEEMGVTSPSAGGDLVESLKKENSSLKSRVAEVEAMLKDLSLRVAKLEGGGRAGAGAAPAAAAKPTPKKEQAKDDDDEDDDVDLFGSDDEEEDAAAAKVREDRLAAYNAKKSKKPVLIAKSSILLDVKPWDDETDMKKMEEAVRQIECDGLLWGASKLVPLAYGIKKLTINCVIEDDKVSTDWLQEEIEKIEDYVQSTDIAAFNKI